MEGPAVKSLELPPSKYIAYFRENGPRLKELAQLTGDFLIVEKIKFPAKKTRSGLIVEAHSNQLSSITSNIPNFFRVLLVGEGYYDDTGEETKEIPLEVNQGDIIQLPSASANIFSSFPLLQTADTDTLGVARAADIQWRFHGEDKFLEFLNGLNAVVAT